jgi:hypothetical protein
MNKEYALWGIAPKTTDEQLLYTLIDNLADAQRIQKILETEHGCTKVRIQCIDFNQNPTELFVQAIN